jgi:hypothetical protein
MKSNKNTGHVNRSPKKDPMSTTYLTSVLPMEKMIDSLEPVSYFNEVLSIGVTVSQQGRNLHQLSQAGR